MNKVKVAVIQTHWRDTVADNLQNALDLVDGFCQHHQTNLICLPEFFTGAPWYFPGRKSFKGIVDDTIPGKITDAFSFLARKYDTYILCGTIVEREGDNYFNTSALLDNHGVIVGKARKIHPYSGELLAIKTANEPLLVDTDLGKIGVCVCSDFWIPEIPRMLALRGCEILCVPGASLIQNLSFTRELILANSVLNVFYTLYSGIVGVIQGERSGRTIKIALGGYSTIASPTKVLSTLNDEETIIYQILDMDYVRQLRQVDLTFQNSLFWCLWGRRPELYSRLLEPYIAKEKDLKTMLEEYMSKK